MVFKALHKFKKQKIIPDFVKGYYYYFYGLHNIYFELDEMSKGIYDGMSMRDLSLNLNNDDKKSLINILDDIENITLELKNRLNEEKSDNEPNT